MEESLGLGKKSSGAETDTETWSWFWVYTIVGSVQPWKLKTFSVFLLLFSSDSITLVECYMYTR